MRATQFLSRLTEGSFDNTSRPRQSCENYSTGISIARVCVGHSPVVLSYSAEHIKNRTVPTCDLFMIECHIIKKLFWQLYFSFRGKCYKSILTSATTIPGHERQKFTRVTSEHQKSCNDPKSLPLRCPGLLNLSALLNTFIVHQRRFHYEYPPPHLALYTS
jgi:hypothetical protein